MVVLHSWVCNPRSAVVFGLVRPSVDIGVPLVLSLVVGVRLGVGRLASELGGHGPVAPWCVRLRWLRILRVSVSLFRAVCRSVLPSCLGAAPAARLDALRYLCQVFGLGQFSLFRCSLQGMLTFDLSQMLWDIWNGWCRARVLSSFALSVPLFPLFFRHLFGIGFGFCTVSVYRSSLSGFSFALGLGKHLPSSYCFSLLSLLLFCPNGISSPRHGSSTLRSISCVVRCCAPM